MIDPSSEVPFSTAPEGPMSPFAHEKAELAREKLKLAADRDAFERDKQTEWHAVKREKESLDEEKSDIARLKQRLNQEITKYFFKKAGIEGGLMSAPALLDNCPPSLSPPSVLRDAAGQDQHQPPLKRKRGRPELERSPDSPTSIPDDELACQRHYLMPADDEEDEDFQSAFVPAPKKRGRPRLNTETNQDGHSSETQAREPKKRGRKKISTAPSTEQDCHSHACRLPEP